MLSYITIKYDVHRLSRLIISNDCTHQSNETFFGRFSNFNITVVPKIHSFDAFNKYCFTFYLLSILPFSRPQTSMISTSGPIQSSMVFPTTKPTNSDIPFITTKPISEQRVCVIGAGPSGLAQLRAFQSARSKGAQIPKIVCYEKQGNWGGMWNYTWRTGLDEHGEPVHGSMYRYLWSNGPKECLEFADYSFDEHFKRPISSYPPREVLWDYIQGRVTKAGVRNMIQFNTVVRSVEFDEKCREFTVTAHCYETDVTTTEKFDYVVVASGHFSTPNVPHFPGFESFGGRILHAHDFRDALEFKNKDILIVGASYSAEDIGSQCYKYGCKSITSCYRSAPMGYKWPSIWEEKPVLQRVEGNKAFFADGSCKIVDAIILCTGYRHHFPFLPDSLCLKTNNRLWPLGLYRGVLWDKNPQLVYLGMQDQWYSFNMFDAQAWYARDVILGRQSIPSTEEMKAENSQLREWELTLQTNKEMFEFQGAYIKSLVEMTDYPTFNIDAVNKTFLEWKNDKYEDIMGYRNKCYTSLLTGTKAAPHHTLWLDALDDSLEAYLRVPVQNNRRKKPESESSEDEVEMGTKGPEKKVSVKETVEHVKRATIARTSRQG